MIFLRNYCTYSQKASMVYLMYITWIFQRCTFWFLCFYNFFYIVHFLMNNIKKCKSSNIKNFFRTSLLQTFAIRDTQPQSQGCPQ